MKKIVYPVNQDTNQDKIDNHGHPHGHSVHEKDRNEGKEVKNLGSRTNSKWVLKK